jgi:DNA-binding HxlR family transcriptional regulator
MMTIPMMDIDELTNKSFNIFRDKYLIEILICLFKKPSGFSEIKKSYNYINQQILSKNIKLLLDREIIEILIDKNSKRKKFSLTKNGKKLKSPLKAIINFELFYSKNIQNKAENPKNSLYDYY